jgi:hypothetical protein
MKAHNSEYLVIAAEVGNQVYTLLINFLLNGLIGAFNMLLPIHAKRYPCFYFNLNIIICIKNTQLKTEKIGHE